MGEFFVDVGAGLLEGGGFGVVVTEPAHEAHLSWRGQVEVPARVTKDIMKGVMFMPFHFAECAANVLTNNALDPIAKIPEFKACAVKVEKITEGS